jgi:hypothetical protein
VGEVCGDGRGRPHRLARILAVTLAPAGSKIVAIATF